MSGAHDHFGSGSSVLDALATAVLDEGGTVARWSREAARLLGYDAADVRGRPVRELIEGGVPPLGGIPAHGRVRLRHRQGGTVEVSRRQRLG